MGIFGEDDEATPPRRPRARGPSARSQRVEVPLEAVSYKIDVEFITNETDEDTGGNLSVEFELSATVEDADVQSHWPELSGNVSYKAPSSGRSTADLASKISDASAAVAYALKQWAKDAERWA